ncbi:YciI family protein [Nonomuraea antri]|uniref:YciI family protein n=1 Tax=Nonomuraea antri TaxID=2730852 RepID=UPI001F3DCA3D|nr:YciI family protein [Nonomuraea antri]
MLMICDDESVQEGPEEIGRRPDHIAWIEYVESRGVVLLGGARLRSSDSAISVRARAGDVLIGDGPFIETKEQIGGFALIECADLDEAVEVAARHPFAAHGVVEVRQVWEA